MKTKSKIKIYYIKFREVEDCIRSKSKNAALRIMLSKIGKIYPRLKAKNISEKDFSVENVTALCV
jgi:hypothetical protein